ncbi:probable disease resistance protein At5g63020 isoform X1 [Macadamia integrifolia]|uniref:probable disease resistance protein At5g63020 isoform X1 n=1 Tax=Macadamia integrifolia TaxID=60698 RepID=UPI001C4E7698|nr:probable disease resistance protein At5g63020 isoform X1 [Macadamia integrifolia]
MASMIIQPLIGWIPIYVIDPIRVRFRISRNLRENIEELENTAATLDARSKDEQARLEEAKRREGVFASAEANRWFTQVHKAVSDASNLKTEYEQRSRGRCLNCLRCSGYKLSKRASKLKQNIDKLYEEELKSRWSTVAMPLASTSSSQIGKGTSTSQIGKGKKMDTVSIDGQTATEKLKREIIDAVLDDRYVVVGLYGMGGIGKTTILRHVYEHFRFIDYFEFVIFVTVSATPDFVEIRKQIANSLGFEKWEDDKDLKKELPTLLERKKYMFIVDDLWQPITDLSELCICAPTKKNGCKILMASRLLPVVTRFVIRFARRDSLHTIRVNSLPPDEAWNLFVQKVGEAITSKPAIEPIAKEVLRKCGGLPLAIIVVGGTMSTRETEGEWKDAVRELEHQASSLEGIEEEVFPILMFSFEKLEPVEQSLFLYCCLFPEDFIFDKTLLYEFAIGEETMCDEMHKLGDLRNKVDVLIGKLRNSSMLEDAGEGDVKLHDVLRELGLWITSSTSSSTTNKYGYYYKFIAKAGARITEAPNPSEWNKATKISLIMNNGIESVLKLPDQCPLLHTLLLRKCTNIKIPQVHFLEQMPALRILDLRDTGITNLPSSISHLVNLRLLCLNRCANLQKLPPEIGMLIQLIWLDLSCCEGLRKLPAEMKKLKNLRRLDISLTSQLERMPHGVFSGLHKLEELDAEQSLLMLYTDSVMELSKLTPRLTSIRIPRAKIRNITISHWLKPLLLVKGMARSLHLQNCVIDPSALPDLLLEDFPDFTKFTFCQGLIQVPSYGCRELIVQCCPDLKALLIVKESKRDAFERLNKLEFDRLDQLETICNGVPLQLRCFTNLRYIEIKGCPNLKVLFTNGVIQLLKKLKSLLVYRCPQLMNIMVSNYEDLEIVDGMINAFPSLEEMLLFELPELTAICQLNLKWSRQFRRKIHLCPKLRRTGHLEWEDDKHSYENMWERERERERVKREEEEKNEKEEEDEGEEEEGGEIQLGG